MVIPKNVGMAWSNRRRTNVVTLHPIVRESAAGANPGGRDALDGFYSLTHHFSMFHMARPAPVVPPNGPGATPWNFLFTKMRLFWEKPKL